METVSTAKLQVGGGGGGAPAFISIISKFGSTVSLESFVTV